MKKYILINKEVASGAPTLNGRRLTVFNIVTKIENEHDLKMALQEYEISFDEAKEAVNYCGGLECQRDKDLIKFCSGCLLRTLQDGWLFRKSDYRNIIVDDNEEKITISKDGNVIFLGDIEELENSEFGRLGWVIANEVKKEFF